MTGSTTGPTQSTGDDHAGTGRWVGFGLGLPIIGWGVRGVVTGSGHSHRAELTRWIVGSAVVLAVGLLARRLVPPRAWPVVRWALSTTAVVVLVSWPFVRGYGRRASIPSLLPRDYGTGVLVAVALVWLAAGVLVVRDRWAAAHQPPTDGVSR
jgi:hypothetical protein